MASRSQWIAATRPRTLPAAIAPVLVGAAITRSFDAFDALLSALAAVVALMLQIGVNFSNDYSDGIRGTDAQRVGPARLVGSGAAPAATVKRAAFACFGSAAVAGLGIVAITGDWWLVLIGLLAIVSAWYYTGGKNPYGYAGLGEVFVFVWFGLVAVIGTEFIATQSLSVRGLLYGTGAGALSCALLVANNLRDIPTDREVGKRTLAVIMGDKRSRLFYVALVWIALIVPFIDIALGGTRWLALALLAAVSAHVPGRAVLHGAQGRELIAVLAGTSRTLLVWAAAVAAALVIG